jgi:hypothetical protein
MFGTTMHPPDSCRGQQLKFFIFQAMKKRALRSAWSMRLEFISQVIHASDDDAINVAFLRSRKIQSIKIASAARLVGIDEIAIIMLTHCKSAV